MDKSSFHFSTELRVRLSETDAMGIVFHGNYFIYFDVGRIDYLRNLGIMKDGKSFGGFDNVIVSVKADFKAPSYFNDVLVVYTRIAEIGNSSFKFEFLVNNKKLNKLVSVGESVHVALDTKKWKPMPVPEHFRKLIRSFEGNALIEKRPK